MVQRWTTLAAITNDAGGFIAYGDYLELEKEIDRLTKAWKSSFDQAMSNGTKAFELRGEIDRLEAENRKLREPPSIEAAHVMGAKGSPAVDAERLAFEAWILGHCWSLSATWDGECYRGKAEHGEYIDHLAMQTSQMWAAWRDRAALTNGQIDAPKEGEAG